MPKNGLGNSLSTLAMPRLNQASSSGSDSIPATTSRPSLMICTILASGNASISPSAQYISAGLASPYLLISPSSTHKPGAESARNRWHSARQVRQDSAVTCQAWANASRSTVAAASPRPSWIDGVLAKA